MALSRAQLNTAVTGELAGVLALGGFAATDTAGNGKEPLDRCFRALGVAESDLATATVADGAEQQALAYLRFFVVDKAVWATASKMDVKAGSASAAARQQHENLLRLWNTALAQAQYYGLPVPGAGQSPYVPVPFGGGVALADYEARADDQSRVPPLFSARDLPNAPAWGEWS